VFKITGNVSTNNYITIPGKKNTVKNIDFSSVKYVILFFIKLKKKIFVKNFRFTSKLNLYQAVMFHFFLKE